MRVFPRICENVTSFPECVGEVAMWWRVIILPKMGGPGGLIVVHVSAMWGSIAGAWRLLLHVTALNRIQCMYGDV
jgi:hypothetical protein